MTKEYLRMQKLSGVITESEYNQKIEDLENPQETTETQETLNEHVVGIGAINNPFLKTEKTDYEIAFEHFVNEEKEPVKEYGVGTMGPKEKEDGTYEIPGINEEDQEEVDADSKKLDKTEDALDQSEEDNESLEDRIKHHEDAIDSIRKELSDLKKDLGEDEEDKKEEEEEK